MGSSMGGPDFALRDQSVSKEVFQQGGHLLAVVLDFKSVDRIHRQTGSTERCASLHRYW